MEHFQGSEVVVRVPVMVDAGHYLLVRTVSCTPPTMSLHATCGLG